MKPTLVLRLAALSLAGLLAACASPAPPPALYQLRGAPPGPVQAVPAPVPGPGPVLQLLLPVALPEAVQRESLLLPLGQAGLQALAGHRWAEPLADAVTRLLRQDLAALLGEARVWAAPLPAGVVITRQCRVEILNLLATPDRSAVVLQARWTLSDPTGRSAPVVQTTQISVPSAGPDVDALVSAHRLALWRLAEQVAHTVR